MGDVLILGCLTCNRVQLIEYNGDFWKVEDDDKCHQHDTWKWIVD